MSENPQKFRHIAPAPSNHRGLVSQSEASSSSSEARFSKRGINIACDTCRRQKSKCNGERPKCSRCRRLGAECNYTSGESTKDKLDALKRKHHEVQEKTNSLERLLEALSTLPEQNSIAVLRKLRSGTDVDTLLRQLQEADLLLQMSLVPETRLRYQFFSAMPKRLQVESNPYLKSIFYEASFAQDEDTRAGPLAQSDTGSLPCIYLQPYHSAEIIDPNLSAVQPSKWTSVIKDDDLARLLLHSYFLHEYPAFAAFQKDIFLEAMIEEDHRLCSPLLVNAVLAKACHCSMSIPQRPQFWNPQTLGYRFMAEAQRLWELQTGKLRLPALQATLILNMIYNNNALDAVGLKYLISAVEMAQELKLFQPSSRKRSDRMKRAREFTAWCLFNWQAMQGYYFYRAPLIREAPPIPLPDPDADPSWYGELWLRYPLDGTLFLGHFGHYFRAISGLRVIINDLGVQSFGHPDKTLTSDEAARLEARLGAWYGSLPSPLQPVNIVFPWHLKLHMEYHACIMALAPMRDDNEIPTSDTPADEDQSFPGTGTHGMAHLETLVRLYYLRHSFEFCDTYVTFFLSIIANAFLELLKDTPLGDGDRESLQSTMILCVKGLYDQGQHVHICAVIYRLLRDRFTPQELETLQKYMPWDPVEQEKPLVAEHVQSQWPLALIKVDEDPTALRLENLIKRYSQISLESTSESSSGGSP